MTSIPFLDVQDGLITGLKAQFDELADGDILDAEGGVVVDAHVGPETPAAGATPNLYDRRLFVTVEIIGGGDDFFSDLPVVRIEVFGRSRAETYAVAEAIRAWLLAAPLVAGGVAIDTATTRTRPMKLPWDGDNIRRWGATYELSVRRR